jgi:transposase-like protein
MKSKYSDEFKLAVIKDYYESTLGVRAIATKYHLPSKNYVNKWEAQLKRKASYRKMQRSQLNQWPDPRNRYFAVIQEHLEKNSMKKKFNILKPELHITRVSIQCSGF